MDSNHVSLRELDPSVEVPTTTNIHDFNEIIKLQREYYEKNKKNFFFKKNQKQECAESICSQMSLEDLMNQTFCIIPNQNRIIFDYRVFKLYGNPNNYMEIVDNVLRFCTWCSNEYTNFEIHVNLATFTISSAERYRDIIILFCDECTRRDTRFTECLISMNLHNVPNIIDQISKLLMPLIPPDVRPKLRIYNRQQTAELNILPQIYADAGKTYVP